MNKQSKRTYRTEAPSLLSLKIVLTKARKDLPPRVWNKEKDEELALELIEKMQTEYKKSLAFREMVKADA